MTLRALFLALWISGTAAPLWAETTPKSDPNADKLADDPTKVITKIGARYSDFATLSGSVAFGPATKINASISEDEQWRFGGSYLFDFGIVNVAASRKELSNGVTQTSYSIGTFAPLTVFGVETGPWQVFPTTGFNYTEGKTVLSDFNLSQNISLETTSKGVYLGAFALRPLTDTWTFKGGAAVSAGSDDFTSFSIGGGLTYLLTPKLSLSGFASYSDSSFGTRDQLGVSITQEF